ncbi:MAG: amidohydrolase family protein [Microthrixaceae bacterium]
MLITRADIRGVGVRDLRFTPGDDPAAITHGDAGRITEITAAGERLVAEPGEDVLDARGGVLMPGLHDHHIHLRAAGAAADSIDMRDLAGTTELAAALSAAASTAASTNPESRRLPAAGQPSGGDRGGDSEVGRRNSGEDQGEWVRVVGYHDHGAPLLDRKTLDEISPPGVPVRVQHRGGALWILNSAALDRLDDLDLAGGTLAHGTLARGTLAGAGLAGVDLEQGHLWRRDDLLRGITTADPESLAHLARRATQLGITGFTDATPNGGPDDAAALARDLRTARVKQRLHLMAPVGATEPAAASLGPVKVLLDDDALPALNDLAATITSAHQAGRPVAIHCVTRLQLVFTLAAFDGAGSRPGDRIEHGSIIPPELIAHLRQLRLTVVSQPHFVAERGDDYLVEVDPDDITSLYRLRSLVDAGVPVAAGTDAPFGRPDPWASIAAAVQRRTPSGAVVGSTEALGVDAAIDLYLGSPDDPANVREIRVGMPADLCLLAISGTELAELLREASTLTALPSDTGLPSGTSPPVAATFIDGIQVHDAS